MGQSRALLGASHGVYRALNTDTALFVISIGVFEGFALNCDEVDSRVR